MIATFTKAQKPPCALAQALRRHDTAGSTHAGERGIVRDDTRYADCLFSDGPVGFERIRRITGYLVGTLDRFNNAKRAEVRDRVKHNQCQTEEEAGGK